MRPNPVNVKQYEMMIKFMNENSIYNLYSYTIFENEKRKNTSLIPVRYFIN